ncbi:phosphoribosyltransferase-like protein [Ferruginibacter sp.]|nr:hypothetical protein [Ferruginibacter sp.]
MDHQQYLDEKMHQLRVVCQSQWDYLKYSDFDKWLSDNFQNDIEGRYYVTKILLHTVYYSKKDMEKLMHYGLYEKIYGKQVKADLVAKEDIYLSTSVAEGIVHQLKESTFFIPLLDSDKPSESGNGIIGDLVHKMNVSENQVDFHRNVTEGKLSGYKYLIFVDDCIGSGNQLKKFWNSAPIKQIRDICEKLSIKIYYIVLIGYDNNIEKLKLADDLQGLEVVVCDLLTDKNRVFSEGNIIWDKDTNEKEAAIAYFEKIKKQKGINFLGYKKLDFAVILHDRLPNWSLPIFWKKNSLWSNLLQRKTSNQ